MRTTRLLVLILLTLSASERGLGGELTPAEKKATIAYIESLRDKETGAYKVTAEGKPSLKACNGAVKSLRALGEKVTEIEKIQKFVLKCCDPKTGAFAEPDGKPDVTITCIGIIAACEVGIDKKVFPKAMGYVLENAKTFEEVRIAAAAVEAWGTKGLKLNPLIEVVDKAAESPVNDPQDGSAREVAAVAVSSLRFEHAIADFVRDLFLTSVLEPGQCADGGWRKKGEKASDIETTYRVMRAFKMLDSKPKDRAQLQKFTASHRNKDGGYATVPGGPSSMSGVYYSLIITKWVGEMEARK